MKAKLSSLYKNRQFGLEVVLMLVMGGVAAAGLIMATAMELKWLVFILIGTVGFSGLMIIREREKTLLYIAVIFLPIKLDFNLFFQRSDPEFYRPISGLVISAFDIPFFLIFMSWMLRLVLNSHEKIRFYLPFTIPYLAMFGLAVMGIGGSTAPKIHSAWSLWMMFQNWLIFMYVANNVKETRTILMVVFMLMTTLVIESFFGLAQHFAGGVLGAGIFGEKESSFFAMRAGVETVSRVGGTLGHPNRLAAYLELLLPLNIALLFSPLKKNFKVVLAGIFCMASLTMLLTYSRGGWIAFGLGALVTSYLCLSRITGRKFFSGIIIAISVVVILVSTITLSESVRRRLFEEDYGAARARIPLAVVALNVIKHHPILGVGFGQYANASIAYDDSWEGITNLFPHPVHNVFLLVAGELGLPALFLFIYIFVLMFYFLYQISKSRDDPLIPFIGMGFLGGLAGWCLHHQVDWEYVLLTTRYWFIFGLVAGMYYAVQYGGHHVAKDDESIINKINKEKM